MRVRQLVMCFNFRLSVICMLIVPNRHMVAFVRDEDALVFDVYEDDGSGSDAPSWFMQIAGLYWSSAAS